MNHQAYYPFTEGIVAIMKYIIYKYNLTEAHHYALKAIQYLQSDALITTDDIETSL